MKVRRLAALVVASAVAVTLAGCGSSSSNSSPGKVKFDGKGPITYVQGKDNSGKLQGLLDQWNKAHPKEKVKLVELSTEADQQRQSMVQNAQMKSDAYCVLSVDNIWVSEFAANRWIVPLPEKEFKKDEILAPVWKTGVYRGKLYAMPHASDGGLLYYRSDLLKQAGINEAPKTWKDMDNDCKAVRKLPGHENIGCYGGQFAKYEGLTVNFDEAVHTAGGETVNADGKVVLNSPEAKKGLSELVNGFKTGFIPKEALTYKEEEGRAAFEAGRILFYRNWPYQYSLSQRKLKGKFGVAPIPGFDSSHPGASSLGGHNAAISTYCKNKGTALEFVKWFTNKKTATFNLKEMSLAPAYSSLYDDPENVKQFPYLPMLKKSIENAAPRPQVINYGDVTAAIQNAVFPALQGKVSADQAITQLDSKLKTLIHKK